ncbi:MAG TPA: hypothetical protein VIW24_29125 [Aldersonia sp.]
MLRPQRVPQCDHVVLQQDRDTAGPPSVQRLRELGVGGSRGVMHVVPTLGQRRADPPRHRPMSDHDIATGSHVPPFIRWMNNSSVQATTTRPQVPVETEPM